jgi:hypothetical protein
MPSAKGLSAWSRSSVAWRDKNPQALERTIEARAAKS